MSKSENWLQRNWDWFIIVVFAIVADLVAWYLRDVIITSTGMLESLTQAEATILALFGIIVAYLMSSYDSRLDRLEQQKFEIDKVNMNDRDLVMSVFLEKRFKEVKDQKRKVAKGVLWVGFSLVLSLLLSVIAFGLREINDWENAKIGVGMFDILFFFLGIYGILLMLYRIGKEPEEPKKDADTKEREGQENKN
jgi:hypothetical protein